MWSSVSFCVSLQVIARNNYSFKHCIVRSYSISSFWCSYEVSKFKPVEGKKAVSPCPPPPLYCLMVGACLRPGPPLFLDQTEPRRAGKNFLRPPPFPPTSSEGLDPPLSPIQKTNRHPSKLYCIFFTRKVSTVIFLLKEVKPSPERQMIKLITFDNLFLLLRHSR